MLFLLCCTVIVTGGFLAGCGSLEGEQGPPGAAGTDGTDVTAGAKAETCTLCHADSYSPPADIHPNAPASVATLQTITATIDSVLVSYAAPTATLNINFTV